MKARKLLTFYLAILLSGCGEETIKTNPSSGSSLTSFRGTVATSDYCKLLLRTTDGVFYLDMESYEETQSATLEIKTNLPNKTITFAVTTLDQFNSFASYTIQLSNRYVKIPKKNLSIIVANIKEVIKDINIKLAITNKAGETGDCLLNLK